MGCKIPEFRLRFNGMALQQSAHNFLLQVLQKLCAAVTLCVPVKPANSKPF